MLARARRKLTVEEFYDLYDTIEEKYELVDGEAWLMSGGTPAHALIAVNITTALRTKLRGTGCRPYNSDLGLRLGPQDLRYPDAAIYCDPRDLGQDPNVARDYANPVAVFEVLSPSTATEDRRVKVLQYKAIASARAIVLVDPLTQTFEMHRRDPDGEWQHLVGERGDDIVLDTPQLMLTAAEIFDLD